MVSKDCCSRSGLDCMPWPVLSKRKDTGNLQGYYEGSVRATSWAEQQGSYLGSLEELLGEGGREIKTRTQREKRRQAERERERERYTVNAISRSICG